MKIIFSLILILECIILFVNYTQFEDEFVKCFTYITTWGLLFTTITFVLSVLFIGESDSGQLSEINNEQSFFKCFKLLIILYQFSIASEILITILYWAIIYNPTNHDKYTSIQIVGTVYCDHIVPLVLLILDYIFLSSIPFTLRLIPIHMMIATLYLIVNLSYSLAVSPVYKTMNWRTPSGII